MRLAVGFAAVLALSAPCAAQAGPPRPGFTPVTGRYVNPEYGFSVRAPPGVRTRRSAAPSPNHGVEMILGAHRRISVFAAFNAAGYATSEALATSLLPLGSRAKIGVARLGGSPAAEAYLAKGDRRRLIVARQSGPEVDDVAVTVDLSTTALDFPRDRRTLDLVLASYRPVPRAR